LDCRRGRGSGAAPNGLTKAVAYMVNHSLGTIYSSGAQGADIMKIQQALQLAGFSPGPIDGTFGSKTKTAVQSFQSAQGITIDGIVGPITWSRLLAGTPPPGERPTITLPATPVTPRSSLFGKFLSGPGSTTAVLGLGLVVLMSMRWKRKRR